jgi:hypothetical protein
MMTLVICGQDIRELDLAYLENGEVRAISHLALDAERYLEGIATTLAQWDLMPAAFGEIIVVAGPGAFTASRLSTTIVNGFAFATGAKIRTLTNEAKLPLKDLIEKGLLATAQEVRYAEPVYDRPPNITVPKHHP